MLSEKDRDERNSFIDDAIEKLKAVRASDDDASIFLGYSSEDEDNYHVNAHIFGKRIPLAFIFLSGVNRNKMIKDLFTKLFVEQETKSLFSKKGSLIA